MARKARAKKEPTVVHFDKQGNLLDQAHSYQRIETNTRDSSELFIAQLRLDKERATYRGGAGKVFFRDTGTGASYPMFIDTLVDVVKNGVIDQGVIQGTWGFEKRGSSQGIYLVSEFRTE